MGDKDRIQHDLQTSSQFDPLAASGNALPVGFRIFIKSKMNTSQLAAITAAAREYGDGGFTLIKGIVNPSSNAQYWQSISFWRLIFDAFNKIVAWDIF